jgi:hypothetical protein
MAWRNPARACPMWPIAWYTRARPAIVPGHAADGPVVVRQRLIETPEPAGNAC